MSKEKTQIDNYRKKIQKYSFLLKDIIGKGYSSQVYNGKDDQTQQPVAIKVIDMKMLKNQFNRQLLQSEIQILKLLKEYQNILHINEVYTTKNNTYIVTQLCSGDLQKQIKSKKKIPESVAFAYFKQILEGYRHIYELGIIHRDLKPANILINKNSILKVADFGFAIKIQKLKSPCNYNVGSPLYMSPEALKNSEYSFKSDVWSLGVILFQMLTGNTPWYAKYQKELLAKMQAQNIEDLIKGYDFSNMAKQILTRCLKIQVNQRINPIQLFRFIETITLNQHKTVSKTPKSGQTQKFRNSILNKNWSVAALNNNFVSQATNVNNQASFKFQKVVQSNKDIIKDNKFISSIPNFANKTQINPEQSEKVKDQKKRKIDQQTTQARSVSKSYQKDMPFKQKNFGQLVPKKTNDITTQTRNVRQSVETTNQLYKHQFRQSVQDFCENLTKKDTSNPHKDQKKGTINNRVSKEKQDEQRKIINRIILSQVHLCRFMFKIIGRIRKSAKNGVIQYNMSLVENMFRSYCQIIKSKLERIVRISEQNFLEIDSLEEYTSSNSFKNIEKLVKDYQAKYSKELKAYWGTSFYIRNQEKNDIIETDTTEFLIRNILSNLKQEIPVKVLFQDRYCQDIIILDYLMTCKQLLDLASGNDYLRFARKSRIDQIVEGNSSSISYDLYLKIKKKAQILLRIN